MKKILKLSALVLAAGFPCAAFAEFLGAPIAASLNAEATLLAFVAVVGALIVARDYASELRPLKIDPSATANPRRSRAYGIRRGADVSRLIA